MLYAHLLIPLIATVQISHTQKLPTTPSPPKASNPPLRVPISTDLKWIQDSLDRHNFFRSLHNVPELSLNNTLSEMSQAWSNYLLAKALKTIEDRKGNLSGAQLFFDHNPQLRALRTGENLYYLWAHADKPNGTAAVNAWYNEIHDYDFNTHSIKTTSNPTNPIGHFTALVWKSTTQMGTAFASHTGYPLPDKTTITFITANYYPGGNVWKRYIENVLSPVGEDNEAYDNSDIIKKLVKFHETPESPLNTPDSWINDAIDKHNEFRQLHSTPSLKRSTELCRVAQNWANLLLSHGILSFNKMRGVTFLADNYNAVAKAEFGESIIYFITPGRDIDASVPAALWYGENRYYDFHYMQTNFNKSSTAKTEHFEQLLWKETTHMGIAFATGELETGQFLTFIVANYYPSGPLELIGRSPTLAVKKNNIKSSGDWTEGSPSFLLGSLVMHIMSRVGLSIARILL